MTQLALFPAAPPARQPHWVQAYNTPTAPHSLNSGYAIPQQCRTCRQWILAARNDPTHYLLIEFDAASITSPQLETIAIALGTPTFQLHGEIPYLRITDRFWPGVPALCRQPASPERPAVTRHTCGRPPLGHQPIPVRPPVVLPDDPPY